jgi:hypothetical protein
MYNFLKIRKDIKVIKNINSDIIFKNRRNELYSFCDNQLICSNVSDFFTFENYIIYNKESSCFIHDIGTNTLKCKEYRYALSLNSSETNSWIFIDTASNVLLFENNFDLSKERLLIKKYDWEFLFLTKENLFLNNKTTLKSLLLLSGEYDWEVDLELYLPNEDYIKTIYGVVGNGLWLTSYWGVLICIDILSGTIVHLLNYENVDYKTPNVGTMYAQSLFDEHNKKLIGVYKKQYWEIDLQNPPLAMQTYDLTEYNSDYFKDEWHNPEGMKFDEDYIYFRDVERSTIGILNRNTKIIDWHNKLRDVEPRPVDIINDIQITKNKIYTLLTDGTLFVFEKDEVVNV